MKFNIDKLKTNLEDISNNHIKKRKKLSWIKKKKKNTGEISQRASDGCQTRVGDPAGKELFIITVEGKVIWTYATFRAFLQRLRLRAVLLHSERQ